MKPAIIPVSSAIGLSSGIVQIASSTSHVTLHIAIIIVATFLFSISMIAYLRVRRKKLLFLSTALFVFALKEYVLFSDIVFYTSLDVIVPGILAPITHVMDLIILLLIFIGIFFNWMMPRALN